MPEQRSNADQANTEQQIANSTQRVAIALDTIAQGSEKDAGCDQTKEDRHSDLCAQWKAADAAADAAYYTKWALFAAITGSGIALCALAYTAKGTRAANDALDAQIASERPILHLSALSFTQGNAKTVKHPLKLEAQWAVENYGRTGCWLESISICCIPGGAGQLPGELGKGYPMSSFIAPGKHIRTGGKHVSLEHDFTPGQKNRIIGTQRLIVWGYTAYRDAGGRRWRTHFLYSVKLDENFTSTVFTALPHDTMWRDERIDNRSGVQWWKRRLTLT